MKLILRSFDLELKHTFTISRQSFNFKPILIVELKDGALSGYGEASENPYYKKTIPILMEDLLKCKSVIEENTDISPEAYWEKIYPYLKHNMFALCAIDQAYNDLYARKKGQKLYELWGSDISKNPMSNLTIGIDTIEKMISKMEENPWPIYKIKLGTHEDIKIVKALREKTDAVLRIDANCAWGVEETIQNSYQLKELGVEFIEQPIPAEDWEGAKIVYNKSVLPIVADESCQIETDVVKCKDHFHGINIKLTKCGGLTPARRMLQIAKNIGLKTMVGCMTESNIGISAIAHLLPELDYVDMDGILLIKQDIATGITMEYGKIVYSNLNGIGTQLKNLTPKTILE